jgi:hypothetical protein
MSGHSKLTVLAGNTSAEEAAAVVAALERFMRAGVRPATKREPDGSAWLAAALREGVARQPEAAPRWG